MNRSLMTLLLIVLTGCSFASAQDKIVSCKTNEDCRVRWGSNCCEDCGGGDTDQLIAYNKNANLEAEVCGPYGGACPPCMPPPYPPYILPVCSKEGHCYMTVIGP